MRSNAQAGINVADVVKNLGVSRRNVELKFKKFLGRSIHTEINSSKMLAASRLLRETDIPVSRIASTVGFSTPSRFFKVFKGFSGLSPGQFRNGVKKRY